MHPPRERARKRAVRTDPPYCDTGFCAIWPQWGKEAVIPSESVLIVEDNGILNVGLQNALEDAGYLTLASAYDYPTALARISDRKPKFCVLDLDLGQEHGTIYHSEPAGRRLLAVLRARGVATIVYSGILNRQDRLYELDESVVTIDKSEPMHRVVEALDKLTGRKADA